MEKLNLENIKKFLTGLDLSPELQEDTNQLVIVRTIDKYEFTTFFRVDNGEKYKVLQIVSFFPGLYQPHTVSDAARLMHLINKDIDAPGLGMDETTGAMFYRTVIPSFDGMLNTTHLKNALETSRVACKEFWPPVAAIASGSITFQDAMERMGLK